MEDPMNKSEKKATKVSPKARDLKEQKSVKGGWGSQTGGGIMPEIKLSPIQNLSAPTTLSKTLQ
jgi:hypothetical protein